MMNSSQEAVGTPIAVFTYNRPLHAEQLLQSLARCSRLSECSVHIYCDGPKDEDDLVRTTALRKVVRDWVPHLNATAIYRSKNLGLARSIVEGVTELVERYGRVIVLEDDFVLNIEFLSYMLQALDRYAEEPRVYQVAGYMFKVKHRSAPDAFFLPVTNSCGWATWARAWNHFKWDATDASDLLQDAALRHQFDLHGNYPYSEMLFDRLNGRNDSWGVLWQWAIFRAEGLVLYPRESLLWVGGFDGTGTHSGIHRPGFHEHELNSILRPRSTARLRWPDNVAIDLQAFKRVQLVLRTQQGPRKPSLQSRIRRRMAKQLQGLGLSEGIDGRQSTKK